MLLQGRITLLMPTLKKGCCTNSSLQTWAKECSWPSHECHTYRKASVTPSASVSADWGQQVLQEAMLTRGMVEGRLLNSCFQSWHLGRVVGTGLPALGHSRRGTASTTAELCRLYSLLFQDSIFGQKCQACSWQISQKRQREEENNEKYFIHLVEKRRRSRLKPSLLNPTILQALAS